MSTQTTTGPTHTHPAPNPPEGQPHTPRAYSVAIDVRAASAALTRGIVRRSEVTNTCDFLLEHGAADDVAVIEGSNAWTYAQLRDSVGALAACLQDKRLSAGSPVVITGGNSFFWVAAYLAVMKMGLVAAPLAASTPRKLREQMAWLGCRTLMADRRALRRLAPPEGASVITEEALQTGTDRYWPDLPASADDDATLMFTSGSTADPKAVRVTHRNLRANTESIIEYLALTRTDRILVVLPFFYCFGASLLHTHLRAGGSVVLCNTFAFPETAVEAMAHHECTGLAGVPSTFAILLRRSTFGQRPLPHLRSIQQAGGRLANPLIQQLQRSQPQAQVFVMYGQTEATARLSYLPPERLADKLGSIGRGIPGVELQVRRADGCAVAPGGRGEIWAQGDNISPGYYRNGAATSDKFDHGWLRTGDLGAVDEDGFIFLIDRKDDFIKTWGHRVSPLEVEECALEMPEVVNAAALGVPDEMAGEIIVMFAEMPGDDSGQFQRLRRHLEKRLPKHLVPHAVHVVSRLPLNANGKVDRRALRKTALAMRTGGET